MWIQGPAVNNNPGPFVKTIQRWAGQRAIHLVAWRAAAGLNDTDAVSGATRLDHNTPLTIEWDLKDKLGALVPDGIYTIRFETADQSSSTTTENAQGIFTFTKGLTRDMQSIPIYPPNTPQGQQPLYREISIDFDPTFGECNNNVVDPGETCDPPGSCPTECPDVSGDACQPNVVVGSSATCSASCAIQPITACISGDGCCAEGCLPTNDDDCFGDDTAVQSGCAAGTGSSSGVLLGFLMVGALGLVTLRRRS